MNQFNKGHRRRKNIENQGIGIDDGGKSNSNGWQRGRYATQTHRCSLDKSINVFINYGFCGYSNFILIMKNVTKATRSSPWRVSIAWPCYQYLNSLFIFWPTRIDQLATRSAYKSTIQLWLCLDHTIIILIRVELHKRHLQLLLSLPVSTLTARRICSTLWKHMFFQQLLGRNRCIG